MKKLNHLISRSLCAAVFVHRVHGNNNECIHEEKKVCFLYQ